MGESLGVYLPAMLTGMILGFGRVVLFTYLLSAAQVGLWGIGAMIFVMGSQLVTLGSYNGLARYVSFYEARGQLHMLYRRAKWAIVICAVVLTTVGLLGSDLITRFIIAPRAGDVLASYDQQRLICWVALANVLAMALYLNMVSFMYGLCAYRLVSVVEVLFGVAFTVIMAVSLMMADTTVTLLLAHLAALAVALWVGMTLLHYGLRQPGLLIVAKPQGMHMPPTVSSGEVVQATDGMSLPSDPVATAPADQGGGVLRRVFGFGLVSLPGGMLWQGATYVSFWLTHLKYGESSAGVFFVFLRLSQPILALANAGWSVVFTHVARRWERGSTDEAISVLQMVYKAVVMVLMSITVVAYATSSLWWKILDSKYVEGLDLIGGLLMFSQTVANLALMTIVAKLRERPIVIAISAIVGIAANVGLALAWMPVYGSYGAAMAGGVGMFVGSGVVTVAYLLWARVRLHAGTWLMFITPALLLLPRTHAVAVWVCLCLLAIFSPHILSAVEKRLLVRSVSRTLSGLWRHRSGT